MLLTRLITTTALALPAVIVCGIAVSATAAAANSAELVELTATPYRPTVSNPAALSAPGYFEFEFGVLSAKSGEARYRNSLPLLVKYAFTENFGLLIGGEPHVSLSNHDGTKISGAGDTTLQLKFKHTLDENSALGLEAGVKADTAKTGIGSGKTDYLFNGIYSLEMGAGDTSYAFDVNLGYTRFGVTDTSIESRHGISWAASIGRSLAAEWNKWSVAFELSGAARRNQRAASQFMTALAYNVSKQVVLDGGVAFGLSKNAPDWAWMAGMTILFK